MKKILFVLIMLLAVGMLSAATSVTLGNSSEIFAKLYRTPLTLQYFVKSVSSTGNPQLVHLSALVDICFPHS